MKILFIILCFVLFLFTIFLFILGAKTRTLYLKRWEIPLFLSFVIVGMVLKLFMWMFFWKNR